MARTPYELRFDILALARTHLMNKFEAQYQWVSNEVARCNLPAEKLKAYVEENKPAYPELDEILKLAEQMNTFVSKS